MTTLTGPLLLGKEPDEEMVEVVVVRDGRITEIPVK